jgi:hypothetical protein
MRNRAPVLSGSNHSQIDYFWLGPHQWDYDIQFNIRGAQFGKDVKPNDLAEQLYGRSKNLNYAYNRRTRLSEFLSADRLYFTN